MLEKDPMKKVKQLRVPDKPPTFLDTQQWQRLLAVVEHQALKSLYEFLFHTGLRVGEALSLTWSSVDLDRMQVSVNNTDTFSTKNRRNRVVPLNTMAYRALPQREGSPYVFIQNGRRIRSEYASKQFKRYARLAGLPEDIHLHSLRHSFASNLAMNNVPLYKIQRLLGHSSPSTTSTFYAHLCTSELHDEVETLCRDFIYSKRQTPRLEGGGAMSTDLPTQLVWKTE